MTSDVERDGATADDPVEVSVKSPNGGEVSVEKSSERSWIGDFVVYGRTVEVEAPDASSADDPIVLTFVVDASVFPATYDVSWLYVYRNGTWVPNCTGAGATPDPCVASRTRLADGDVEMVVRTTQTSLFTVGVTGPTAEAGGPYVVDEGTTVQLDAGGSTGTQTPLTYAWSPISGLDDIATATPSLDALDDGVQSIELTVIDSIGLTDTDVAEVVVENVAPTATFSNSGPVEAGQSFQLSLTNPQDPSPVDTAAGFEYAFDCGNGAGYGPYGTASTRTCPTTAAGTRTVKGRIRDKDGGVSESIATVRVAPSPSICAGPPPAGAIVRGSGNHTINGSAGDDVIFDSGGNNTINGRGGHDVICTGSGNDRIDGGTEDDLVVDTGGKNTIAGGLGRDRIVSGSGDDAIDGGDGDDNLSAGGGNNNVKGGAGNDRVTAASGNDKLDGGAGNDTIDGGSGNNTVTAGAGDDTITTGAGNDSIDGGPGFDTCRPGSGSNTVRNCEA